MQAVALNWTKALVGPRVRPATSQFGKSMASFAAGVVRHDSPFICGRIAGDFVFAGLVALFLWNPNDFLL
jgi:hypothetical protein